MRVALLSCALVFSMASLSQGQLFIRGDADMEGFANLTDSVYIASYLYSGGPAPVLPNSGDVNDNGTTEISDIVYLLHYLFQGGPWPPSPFPLPGMDLTPDPFDPPIDPDIVVGLPVTINTVPGEPGLNIPLTMTNNVEVDALEVALTFDPTDVTLEDWVFTGSVLSSANAEFIIDEIDNVTGVAWLASVVDFATSITGKDIDPGTNQLIATLSASISPTATAPQFVPIAFSTNVGSPPKQNLVVVNDGEARIPTTQDATIRILVPFLRADANRDDILDISDAIYMFAYFFDNGAPPPCEDSADSNNDGQLDIADQIYLLNFLFTDGPQPSQPYPIPGLDPDNDFLNCLN